MREELYKRVQESNWNELKDYGADWLYEALSSICRSQGKDVTVENMLLFAPALDSDLEDEFAGAGGEEFGFEEVDDPTSDEYDDSTDEDM